MWDIVAWSGDSGGIEGSKTAGAVVSAYVIIDKVLCGVPTLEDIPDEV